MHTLTNQSGAELVDAASGAVVVTSDPGACACCGGDAPPEPCGPGWSVPPCGAATKYVPCHTNTVYCPPPDSIWVCTRVMGVSCTPAVVAYSGQCWIPSGDPRDWQVPVEELPGGAVVLRSGYTVPSAGCAAPECQDRSLYVEAALCACSTDPGFKIYVCASKVLYCETVRVVQGLTPGDGGGGWSGAPFTGCLTLMPGGGRTREEIGNTQAVFVADLDAGGVFERGRAGCCGCCPECSGPGTFRALSLCQGPNGVPQYVVDQYEYCCGEKGGTSTATTTANYTGYNLDGSVRLTVVASVTVVIRRDVDPVTGAVTVTRTVSGSGVKTVDGAVVQEVTFGTGAGETDFFLGFGAECQVIMAAQNVTEMVNVLLLVFGVATDFYDFRKNPPGGNYAQDACGTYAAGLMRHDRYSGNWFGGITDYGDGNGGSRVTARWTGTYFWQYIPDEAGCHGGCQPPVGGGAGGAGGSSVRVGGCGSCGGLGTGGAGGTGGAVI